LASPATSSGPGLDKTRDSPKTVTDFIEKRILSPPQGAPPFILLFFPMLKGEATRPGGPSPTGLDSGGNANANGAATYSPKLATLWAYVGDSGRRDDFHNLDGFRGTVPRDSPHLLDKARNFTFRVH